MTRGQARRIGLAAIVVVFALQAFNSLACYHHDLPAMLQSAAIFVALPMLPALAGLVSANPLRALGGAAGFAPWLLFAYWADCVRPDGAGGGGASFTYVAVLMYGAVTGLLGVLLTGPAMRWRGIRIDASG